MIYLQFLDFGYTHEKILFCAISMKLENTLCQKDCYMPNTVTLLELI